MAVFTEFEYVRMDQFCVCKHSKNKKAKVADLAIKKNTIYSDDGSLIYITEGRCPFCGHCFIVNCIILPSAQLEL